MSGGLPLLKSDAYSNCRLVSPEGILMCFISRKRANWYVTRNLAEVIQNDPYTIKLKFVPNGMGNSKDVFYLTERENVCVVCGTRNELTKHHCIPYCFRKYFPDNYKKHSSHDIVLLCKKHHQEYESIASKIKLNLVSVEKTYTGDRDTCIAIKAAKTILKHYDKLPYSKFSELMNRIEKVCGPNFTDEDIKKLASIRHYSHANTKIQWKEYVENLQDLNDFIEWWRKHFVDTMKPKYLPKHWSVFGRYHR